MVESKKDNIEVLEVLKNNEVQKLYNELVSLKEKLEIEIEKIKKGSNYVPNSLGIVQEQGRTIDIICSRIATQQEAINIVSEVSPY